MQETLGESTGGSLATVGIDNLETVPCRHFTHPSSDCPDSRTCLVKPSSSNEANIPPESENPPQIATDGDRVNASLAAPEFYLSDFLQQCNEYMAIATLPMYSSELTSQLDPQISDYLLCLTEKEFKYLPLWAGGFDDGTNGVFDSEIPDAEEGAMGPGRSGMRRGNGRASTTSSDSFDMVSGSSRTYDTSTVVEDGFSDTLDRRRVVAAPSTSGGSEAEWSAVGSDVGTEIFRGKVQASETDSWSDVGTEIGHKMSVGKGNEMAMDEDEITYRYVEDDEFGDRMTGRSSAANIKGKARAIEEDDATSQFDMTPPDEEDGLEVPESDHFDDDGFSSAEDDESLDDFGGDF
jgi:hypothetical protein